MSSFGRIYRVTTFGESHSQSVGVVIEGIPPRMELSISDIQPQLTRRRPGQSRINTDRNEKDVPIIQCGTENGLTLGTPICIIVKNKDTRPEDYVFNKQHYVYRPSHADYTYWNKYGIHAASGGGRSSARETVSRVIAGAIAEKWLKTTYNINIVAFVSSIGKIKYDYDYNYLNNITREEVDKTIVRCPDITKANEMIKLVEKLKKDGDSTGGIITCVCRNVPIGIGEPCFDKLEALLAHGMLSIPSTKGFEIGSGFKGTEMKGSEHNDRFVSINDKFQTITNYSGGIQGGISNTEHIYFNVAFKPPSTIMKEQETVDVNGIKRTLKCKGRHDPCVVNRAVPIVEAMTSIILMDNILIQKTRK